LATDAEDHWKYFTPVFFLGNYKKIFHRMNLVVEKFVHIYEKNVDTEMLINKK